MSYRVNTIVIQGVQYDLTSPIEDSCSSASTTSVLSARQGMILQEQLNNTVSVESYKSDREELMRYIFSVDPSLIQFNTSYIVGKDVVFMLDVSALDEGTLD